jgi:hypothetical protein
MLSPLAATEPDGLEALAERAGFANQALPPAMELFPDYTIPLLSNSILTTLVAVGLGTVLVFLVGLALGRLLRNPTRV